MDGLQANRVQIVDCNAEANCLSNGGCPGLESLRNIGIQSAFQRHVANHAAATLERRKFFKHLALTIQHADPGRAKHLVTGKRHEIRANCLNVEREMWSALDRVD